MMPEHLTPKKPKKPFKPNTLEISSGLFLLMAVTMFPTAAMIKVYEQRDIQKVSRAYELGCLMAQARAANPGVVNCKEMSEMFKEVYSIEVRGVRK